MSRGQRYGKCLQGRGEKKCMPIVPLLWVFMSSWLDNSSGLIYLYSPISLSFHSNWQTTRWLLRQSGFCFPERNASFTMAFFLQQGLSKLSNLISQTNQTTPLLKHVLCFPSSALLLTVFPKLECPPSLLPVKLMLFLVWPQWVLHETGTFPS